MAETEIRFEIVTPDSTVYSDIVDHVVVPTANGKVDLYQHHAPLIDRPEPSDIKIQKDGKIEYLAVGSGFVEVYAEKVSIITDQAISVEKDNQEEIDRALKRAQDALDEGRKSNIDEAQRKCLRRRPNSKERVNSLKGKAH